MKYPWREQAEREGIAAKVPAGRHRLRIIRVRNTDADGNPWISQSNAYKIMIICADDQARECSMMVTLSDKGAFILARLMGCFDPPMNLEEMERTDVEPAHFADLEYANFQLVNREFWGDVTWTEPDSGGKTYSDIRPVKPADATAGQVPYEPPPQMPPPQAPPATTHRPAFPSPTKPPTAQAPPRMPPPPTPPPRNGPPPSEPPPSEPPPSEPPPSEPQYPTEKAAWNAWCEMTASMTSEADKAKRNARWYEIVKEVMAGRPKMLLGPADWSRVVELLSVPF